MYFIYITRNVGTFLELFRSFLKRELVLHLNAPESQSYYDETWKIEHTPENLWTRWDSSNLLVRMPGILKHDGTFLYYTWKFDLLANWSMPFANAGIHAPHAVLLTSSPAEFFCLRNMATARQQPAEQATHHWTFWRINDRKKKKTGKFCSKNRWIFSIRSVSIYVQFSNV